MKNGIRTLLHVEFQKRQNKNSKYSLRSFARDLSISPSMISRFMSGEREPSLESLQKLLLRLKIDESTKKQILMAAVNQQDFNIPKDEEYQSLTLAHRARINDWVFSCILELFRSRNRKFTSGKIAKLLKISATEVEKRIDVLTELGLLQKTQSGYRTTSLKQSSLGLGAAVSKIHQGYLEKATLALDDPDRSNISGATVLVHPKRLAEAQERIKNFRRSLSAFLAVKPEENDEELYRIQIALFPLE